MHYALPQQIYNAKKGAMVGVKKDEVTPLIARRTSQDYRESGGSESGCCSGCAQIRKSRNTAIVIMFLAFMLDIMLLTVVEPVLPDILKNILLDSKKSELAEENNSTSTNNATTTTGDVEVTPLLVGIMNGAKPLTQVLLNPIIGVIVDKVGHTFPMLIGFIVALLSTVGFAFLNDFGTLLAARCLQGAGSSLMTIPGLAMLSSMFVDERERGKAMAIAFSGLAFGLIIGFPFGSIVYQFLGREVPFLIMALFIFVGLVLRFCLMPLKVTDKTIRIPSDGNDHCSGFTVCLDPYILIAAGVYFWLCYGVGSILGVGPLYLLETLKAEQWHLGILYLTGALSQTVFQYSMAYFGFKANWWPFSLIGLILVAIGAATYTLPTTIWLTLLPQCLYSAGIGFVMGSIPPLLGRLADIRMSSRYGAVYALSDTGTNLGYFLGSTITGLVVNSIHSYTITYGVTAAVVFCYSFTCILLRNVPEKETVRSEEVKQALLAKSWKQRRHSFSSP